MSSSPEVPVVESAEAEGADRILPSPDGRWMVLRYGLQAQLPFLVRLDRHGQEPPRVLRGIPAGPPRNDGTMYYVEHEAADMRTIMARPASERRSHLRRLGSPEPLLSRDGAYRARLVDENQLVMIGDAGARTEIMLVDPDDGQVRASREFVGLGYRASSSIDSERIFLLFDPSSRVARPQRLDGLILVALATEDLRELWRHEALKPSPIFTRPSLGTTAAGRRLLLMSWSSRTVVTFDAATGEPGPELIIPRGSNELRLVHEVQPRQEALVLWTKTGRGATSGRGWQMLVVRDDRIDVVVERWDELPPGAGAWDGHQVVLAPWGAPRWEDHPEEWEEPFKSYVELLDGQER